jgi:hypothetical protein
VKQLVADDRADAAIVDRRVGFRVEEGRLQDARREGDLVGRRAVISVDLRRRHQPQAAVSRLADLLEVEIDVEARGAQVVFEERAAVDHERRVIDPLPLGRGLAVQDSRRRGHGRTPSASG